MNDSVDSIIENIIPRHLGASEINYQFNLNADIDLHALNQALTDPIWELLDRGGKRWRPKLFSLTVEACDGDIDRVRDFIAFPELLHTGSLIIDDIEDDSLKRRGEEVLHEKYDIDIAINAGNFLYFLPLKILKDHKDKFSSDILLQIYSIYTEKILELHFGQGIDIQWQIRRKKSVTEDKYLSMCALKSGSLAELTAKLAAVLCDVSSKKTEILGKLGKNIGVVFQII